MYLGTVEGGYLGTAGDSEAQLFRAVDPSMIFWVAASSILDNSSSPNAALPCLVTQPETNHLPSSRRDRLIRQPEIEP